MVKKTTITSKNAPHLIKFTQNAEQDMQKGPCNTSDHNSILFFPCLPISKYDDSSILTVKSQIQLIKSKRKNPTTWNL